mmetsp:Transcript_16928/g.48402  ORF Transcript_16928/g.48402 Transcript_16928/m.48402 type:complete len:210 (+) Transcript_16928:181-810(+)
MPTVAPRSSCTSRARTKTISPTPCTSRSPCMPRGRWRGSTGAATSSPEPSSAGRRASTGSTPKTSPCWRARLGAPCSAAGRTARPSASIGRCRKPSWMAGCGWSRSAARNRVPGTRSCGTCSGSSARSRCAARGWRRATTRPSTSPGLVASRRPRTRSIGGGSCRRSTPALPRWSVGPARSASPLSSSRGRSCTARRPWPRPFRFASSS